MATTGSVGMPKVLGTRGYERDIDRFVEVSESVDVEAYHACWLPRLSKPGSRCLDLGAGSGRDAAALAARGHSVVAVEPLDALLTVARQRHRSEAIRWIGDSLPELALLDEAGSFDAVLCHGVWQHLSPVERLRALERIAELMAPGGFFALALRHGSRGPGTTYYPSTVDETKAAAAVAGLGVVLCLENQPSWLPGKADIVWSRLVLTHHYVEDNR